MKHAWFLLALFFLGACSPKVDVAAEVGDRVITRQEVEAADAFYGVLDPQEQATAQEARKREVLQQLAYDALIMTDASLSGYDPTADAQAAWAEEEQRYGGREGLLSQLQGYGLTEASFRTLLQQQAMAQEHRRRFEEREGVSDDALRAFYQKFPARCQRIDYTDYVVATRAEAEEIKASLEADPKVGAVLERQYETDLFDTTYVRKESNVSRGDAAFFDEALSEQAVHSVQIYVHEEAFHTVVLEAREEDFETLRPHIRTLYLDEAYRAYLNGLAKAAGMRLYPENLMFRNEEGSFS